MKIRITRASVCDEEVSPLNEAVKERAFYLHWKTVESLIIAAEKHWYDRWVSITNNRREENGMVVGDSKIRHPIWVLEITSLEALYALVKKEGDIIVRECSYYKGCDFEIMIYDGYIE